MNQTKSNVGLMFAATGEGTLLTPQVMYRAKHLYDLWSEGDHAGARYYTRKTGWIANVSWIGLN